MLELGIKLVAAYFLGSIVGALVIGSFRGVDIRTLGSGNAGGTNALRTQGLAFAAATVVIDVGKGWLAAGWLPSAALPGIPADPAVSRDWLAACCAAAAVAGHVWPIWHDFRGGKGGATLAGALLALAPVLLVIAVATWLGFAVLFGFVGLATVAAALSVPVAVAISAPESTPWLAFGIAMAALVAWAHRGNFARMRAGQEPRTDKLWLFRPRSALLDATVIQARLPQAARDMLRNLEVHDSLASTSDRLLAVTDLPGGRFDACLAEFQSAGRGRRGRQWVAPFASGLCLSVSWSFRDAPAALGALSLAAGVAVLRALARSGFGGLSLKWPNDIVRGDAKLGGILIDLRGESAGPAYVVIGIGINVRLPRAARERLAADGVEAADLASLGTPPARSELAALIIAELVHALVEFGARGLAAFADEWSRADVLAGRPVRVLQGGQALEGVARGVDGDGALLLEAAGSRQRILSGEVSVRPVR